MAEDIVKSVDRVFEVIELFGSWRQPLNATQIERLLHYPQSSTFALLKSLVALGYLSFDRIEHSYFPTMRYANLGQCLNSDPATDKRLLAALAHFSATTNRTVALACQNDLRMQWVQVWPGCRPATASMTVGQTDCLFNSTHGKALLSTMADVHIARLAQRLRRAQWNGHDLLDVTTLIADIEAIRLLGHATGQTASGNSIIAWPLGDGNSGRAMALAVIADPETQETGVYDIVRTVQCALRSAGFGFAREEAC